MPKSSKQEITVGKGIILTVRIADIIKGKGKPDPGLHVKVCLSNCHILWWASNLPSSNLMLKDWARKRRMFSTPRAAGNVPPGGSVKKGAPYGVLWGFQTAAFLSNTWRVRDAIPRPTPPAGEAHGVGEGQSLCVQVAHGTATGFFHYIYIF